MNSIVFVAVIFAAASIEASTYAPAAPAPAPAMHSYGSPSPPAVGPPCPKSILVSCAPSVRAVPCSSGGGGGGLGGYGAPSLGGGHGAYSENTPQYAVPSLSLESQYAAPQPQPYTAYGTY